MRNKIKFVNITLAFLIFCLLVIIYLGYSIISFASISVQTPSDAAIILGAGIDHDKPSPVFKERINHAITLYNNGTIKYLIFTGGLGKGKRYTEAEVALNYAVKQGIPKKAIFLEQTSTITYENILQAKKILHSNNLNSVLMVSDPLHMKRAITMATDLGMNVNTAPTPTSMYKSWSTQFGFLVREIYFYSGYLLRKTLF